MHKQIDKCRNKTLIRIYISDLFHMIYQSNCNCSGTDLDMNSRILLFVGGAIMSGLFNVGSNTEEAAFEGELDFTGIV